MTSEGNMRANKSNSDSYRTIVGHSSVRNQVQRIVQRELPSFAGFCGGGEKERIPKIIDFQDSYAICFRLEWSHLGLNQGLPDYETFVFSLYMTD